MFKKLQTQELLEKFIDERQLVISLKFLKSPYLEKRVKGVTEIKDLTERIELMKKRTISRAELVKFIKENQILETLLLGDSVHCELVKRCSEIVIFLTRNNAFAVDMIDKIWL
jgi:ubiquitin carboxyl-terminal hydrolase 9/24